MNLQRPIVFFDLEATGLDWQEDRIIEIACVRLNPDGSRFEFESLVDPEREIPAEVTELTGISNEDVADKPAFHELSTLLEDVFDGADLAGYNAANFDVPMLRSEFDRVGKKLPVPDDMVVLDSLEILRKHEIRTLAWTYDYYFKKEFPEAHRAIHDVNATVDILNEQVGRYDLDGTPRDIVLAMRHPYLDGRRRFIREEEAVKLCFGRHKGLSLAEVYKVEASYIDWMLDNLEPEVQVIIRAEMEIIRTAETPDAS